MTEVGRVALTGYIYSPSSYPITPNAFQASFGGGQTDGIVTVFDMLLLGAELHGTSTPARHGPLNAGVTEMPQAGSQGFPFYLSGAPQGSNGWLLIGEESAAATSIGGASIWLDLSNPSRRVPAQTDEHGYSEIHLPLPAQTQGQRFAAQYLIRNTPECNGSTAFSSSNALKILVQ